VNAAVECELCGESATDVVCSKNGYDGVLCRCGAMRIRPEPPPDAVDHTHDPHPAWFYSRSADLKLAWLARTHPRGRLLEVGCGDGYFLEAAKRRGYDVSGMEPDPARAQRTAQRLNIDVENAYIERSERIEPIFDVVYHCDLLSHFPDARLAFTRMAARLKPGGVLFFEVGVYGNIPAFWYQRMPETSFPRHRRIFSAQNMTAFLNACGLRIVRKKLYGLAPHILAYRAALGVRRALRPGAGSGAVQSTEDFNQTRVEHPLVQRIHTFMRYRVGACAPGWGPQTMLIIAAPCAESPA
jgi:SAM-dependent methyltransferase